MRTLLALAAVLLAATPTRAHDDKQLFALRGPLDTGLVRELTARTDYYGDYGEYALGEADDATLAALRESGLEPTALGAWPEDAGVLVTTSREPLPSGARVLLAGEHQDILAVPADVLAERPHLASGCHAHGAAAVTRKAWAPAGSFQSPLGPQGVVAVDGRVASMVAPIDGDAIETTVSELSAYFTRRADSAEALLAAADLVAEFQAIPGLTVSQHVFTATETPNIVAELPGTTHPERVIVLGAHYDSINSGGELLAAPGADDNASGVGGVLETARALSQHSFENTIRFVLFGSEEFGLLGSAAYAEDLVSEPGVEPIAMLNMDMIAHLHAGDDFDLDFVSNNTDPTLIQFCRDVAAGYVPTLPTRIGTLLAGTSDHQSFQSVGVPAVFFFEDLNAFTPDLHSDLDLPGSSANDFELAEQITRVFAAAAALLAEPVDMSMDHDTPLGDTTDASGPYRLAVTAQSLTAASVAQVDVMWRVDEGAWQSRALLPGNTADTWVGSLPGVAEGIVHYHFVATDTDGNREWLPEGTEPGKRFFGFSAGQVQTLVSDDFESVDDNGWTTSGIGGIDWERGEARGESGDADTAVSGTRIWGNSLGEGFSTGSYWMGAIGLLWSPYYDLTGASNVHLRYWRWLTVEDGVHDEAEIWVNGDTVWANPIGTGDEHHLDAQWTLHDIDVSAVADDNASVRLLFRMAADSNWVQFGGWNIDDVSLVSVLPGVSQALTASEAYVSASQGGSVDLTFDAGPASAGRDYLIMLGVSGTEPGTPVDFVNVPINFDVVTELGISIVNSPALVDVYGLLDGNGRATATFNTPPVSIPGLPGLKLQMAALTLFPADVASNAIEIEYVP